MSRGIWETTSLTGLSFSPSLLSLDKEPCACICPIVPSPKYSHLRSFHASTFHCFFLESLLFHAHLLSPTKDNDDPALLGKRRENILLYPFQAPDKNNFPRLFFLVWYLAPLEDEELSPAKRAKQKQKQNRKGERSLAGETRSLALRARTKAFIRLKDRDSSLSLLCAANTQELSWCCGVLPGTAGPHLMCRDGEIKEYIPSYHALLSQGIKMGRTVRR